MTSEATGQSQLQESTPAAELASLAGGLAHEIRNPLSTIGMNLELLAEEISEQDVPGSGRMLKRVSSLQNECMRLEEILNDFLRFAKAGELELKAQSLNDLLTEFLEFFAPEADEHKVDVRPHLDSGLPLVHMDRQLMRQVLVNLARNALQAMPDGGLLELLTFVRDNQVVLEVIDTGCGMDSATTEKMFQAFYSTRSGGSGLGLPTVRRIIEAHGGTVSCESAVGRGTRFTIALPIRDSV